MSYDFDAVAIGGGSFGFNAARVFRQKRERVAIVDGASELGGLCILKGCMPSKTLLYSAEILHQARRGRLFGLALEDARADMKALRERKRRIIGEFAAHRRQAMEGGRYTLLRASARFVDAHTLELSDGRRITAEVFFVGAGSCVSCPAVPGLAESSPWTSDDVLDLDFVPESVIVLGGGVVACELAQYLRRIGARVTQVQRSAQILKGFSADAAAAVAGAFAAEGIELLTGTKLERVRRVAGGYEVEFQQGGRTLVRRARHLLNALGREPNTAGLNLAAAGVELGAGGRIPVNSWQQTRQAHIYAGGDCTGPHEIVHLAVAQGELAARHASGAQDLRPVDSMPLLRVAFTDPPVAAVGSTGAELAAAGRPCIRARYPFDDHGKSILMEAKHGFVEVAADPGDGRILGAEIVGPDAGEMIHSLAVAISLGASARDLLRAPWYHPTLAEILTYPLEEIVDALE